ncbi:FtsW/RodA/SpoVE family cell cycle protein [Fusobacterium sp.]|uniref:FtsW/RodA/SpoVE family cell cycle protein n=1 Tax=Fusobacterium sp. TaxID=68766 RepID=UPI0026085B29|nr:FtsW/RodA/SpoVE family cell cycle protein [Fusobacterium sp.]
MGEIVKVENKSIYYEKKQVEKELYKRKMIPEVKANRRFIFILVFIFLFLSVLNLYSVSDYQEKFSLKSMIIFMIIGSIMGFFISAIDYKILRKKWIHRSIYWGSLILLAVMFVFGRVIKTDIIKETNGAYGWIRIGGIGIQPSEILKLAFIILISLILESGENKKEDIKDTLKRTLKVSLPFFCLIFSQNDLGTVIHYVSIYIILIFFTKIKTSTIVKIVSALGSLGLIAITLMYKFGNGDYRVKRVIMWIDGLLHDGYVGNIDIGYQVAQSLLAFGNGGIFGVGYGNGVQKFSYLPEIHTDFIMALLGEELGFCGLVIVLILFFLLYYNLLKISRISKDYLGKYLAVGVAGMIITQVLINLFVTVGLLPVFGIPMPFFSYGGTSILTILMALGLVLSVNNYTVLEFDKTQNKLYNYFIRRGGKKK